MVVSRTVTDLYTRGMQEKAATPIGKGIYLSYGNSNAYRVVTPEGSVVIDTGLGQDAQQIYSQLRAADPSPIKYLVYTHAHPDHVGGDHLWRGDNPFVIAHRLFPERDRQYRLLPGFHGPRAAILWGQNRPGVARPKPRSTDLSVDLLVDDYHRFHLGGLTFELLWIPAGEGQDGIAVWIPELKALFCGDVYGPIPWAFPNLFTLRGETMRMANEYITSMERLLTLDAEVLLPGHFEVMQGAAEIRNMLTRMRDAVAYVHDETVRGMNAGKDLWTLMREIKLPKHLELSEQYGRVDWGVRAIWETYVGWFRFESTTELYPVPAQAVYSDLVKLAGGPGPLAMQAQQRMDKQQPLEALHLCEIALSSQPDHKQALQVQLHALNHLLADGGTTNFQLAGWLSHNIRQTEERLAKAR